MMPTEEVRELIIVLCFVWLWLGVIVGSGVTWLWVKHDQDESDNQQTFKENHYE